MAVDTATKRYSALNPTSPWRGLCLFPDGTITNKDRAALRGLYAGLAFAISYQLDALTGSFAWTGNSATLTPTTNINTATKRFAALNIGNPWRGLNTYPLGSIGRASRISLGTYYSGLGQQYTYTLEALTATFFMDAEPAFSDFEIAATTATFAMTGNAATLIATRTLYATTATFAMTGNAANLNHYTERTLAASSGSFAMTGNSVVFDRPRTLTAEAVAFDMTGYPATLDWSNAPPPHKIGVGASHKPPKKRYEKPETITLALDEEEVTFSYTALAENILRLASEWAQKQPKPPYIVVHAAISNTEKREIRQAFLDAFAAARQAPKSKKAKMAEPGKAGEKQDKPMTRKEQEEIIAAILLL